MEFDKTVLTAPAGLLASFVLPFRLALVTRLQYWKLMRFRAPAVIRGIDVLAAREGECAAARGAQRATTSARICARFRRVAEFTATSACSRCGTSCIGRFS